jgi:hypothetical protein
VDDVKLWESENEKQGVKETRQERGGGGTY